MTILLGGVLLALAFVIAGVVVVARAVPVFGRRMKDLKATVGSIPIAKAVRDLERLQLAINGLEALVTRARRIGRSAP